MSGQRLRLNYPGVTQNAANMGLPMTSELWSDIKICEQAALAQQADEASKKTKKRPHEQRRN